MDVEGILHSGGILSREDVMSMAAEPIVFAMANPNPDIRPEEIEDIVAVVVTGRSDYISISQMGLNRAIIGEQAIV